jgi:hypothetical protein
MANERKTYNFRTQSGQSALAARIASIKTKHIEEIIKLTMGVSVNIMQRFNAPQKCEAAIYIVDNAPQTVLQSVLAQNLTRYEADVRNAVQGRPVHLYRHDPDHDNRTFNRNDVVEEALQKIKIEEVAQIIKDASVTIESETQKRARESDEAKARTQPQEAKALPIADDETEEKIETLNEVLRDIINSKKGAMDEDRVREIAREEDDKLGHFIQTAIKEAMAKIIAPTIVHVQYKDDATALRDMGLQHKLFPRLLQLVEAGFPVWIPGPAGSGKTTAVLNACKALNATLYMPPEGPIENKYGMVGYMDATGKFVETSLYHACIEARDNPEKVVVYFIDECDAAYANALMVMNAVMENGYCTFANGERVQFGNNLQFIAGANTFGNGATHDYVGRNKLDGATLDRFITLAWDYDEALETAMVNARFPGQEQWVKKVQRIRKVARDIGKHIVSPRASLRGAKLLSMGMDEADVLKMTVYKSMTSDTVSTITARM